MDRVRRAKQAEPKWDPHGEYAAKCAELARAVHKEPAEIIDEHNERAAIRYYEGGIEAEQAEALAWVDVLSRFEVVL